MSEKLEEEQFEADSIELPKIMGRNKSGRSWKDQKSR